MKLENLMIDASNAERLRDFYANLTGWKKITIFNLPGIISDCGTRMIFNTEEDYVPCVWPEQDGCQQKQMHLDLQTSDVNKSVQLAESLGAVKAPDQFGGDEWITMLDPDGHPFCLCKEGNLE